jgi:hypothetical protein
MTCGPDVLRSVPLFALLDDDETAVLASQVELKRSALPADTVGRCVVKPPRDSGAGGS